MSLRRVELMKIPDATRAAYAVEDWARRCESYADIGYWVGRLEAAELIGPGQTYFDPPTAIARERAAKMILAQWRYHRCQVIAEEAVEAAFELFEDRARACGIKSATAHTFLSTHIRADRLRRNQLEET